MFKSQEIMELLKNVPQGFLKPDDLLFNVSCSNILKPYKKLGAISSAECENINDSSGSSLCTTANEIFCNVMGCSMIFDNTSSYQSHYNSIHRFICSECKKSLPTEHLLDLHISEHHDSYFNVRVERGECLFRCYLEDCKDIFPNLAERKEHCINQHKLPGNFRFDQVACKKQPKISKLPKTNGCMEVDEQNVLNHKNNPKTFSFGHQKVKTFVLRNGPKQKQKPGETLENMETLTEALNSL